MTFQRLPPSLQRDIGAYAEWPPLSLVNQTLRNRVHHEALLRLQNLLPADLHTQTGLNPQDLTDKRKSLKALYTTPEGRTLLWNPVEASHRPIIAFYTDALATNRDLPPLTRDTIEKQANEAHTILSARVTLTLTDHLSPLINRCTSLQALTLQNTQATHLPPIKLPHLRALNLSNNPRLLAFPDLPDSHHSLRYIDARGTLILNLDTSSFPHLEQSHLYPTLPVQFHGDLTPTQLQSLLHRYKIHALVGPALLTASVIGAISLQRIGESGLSEAFAVSALLSLVYTTVSFTMLCTHFPLLKRHGQRVIDRTRRHIALLSPPPTIVPLHTATIA